MSTNVHQVAVSATIPWDSYLIRRRIWSYPPDVVVGYTLYDIPAEELFFFVIQTFNTSILYLILNKPTFHPAYLRSEKQSTSLRKYLTAGQLLLGLALIASGTAVHHDGVGTYLGLIIGWAGPFMLLLW
jgi:15-cis-phytoene synthase/lycopene beta-cyclase